jgi:prepilin-type N-terminal cleavage/methylation domain-containing protein
VRSARGLQGFTLVEILAVMFLTALVMTAAADFYVDLSHKSNLATQLLRDARRSVALLDRLSRDLQGAMLLVKPEEMDPLEHPWIFLAERGSGEGADRVKFVTRSHRPRGSAEHESNLAVMAFVTVPGDDGTSMLLRSVTPRLPEALDRDFPRNETEADVLAEGLARFEMRFQTEEGEWTDEFDSSSLVYSGQLPVAVEIKLAFAVEGEDGLLEEGELYERQVPLPMRPIDLEALLEEEEGSDEDGESEEDEDCITVDECRSRNQAAFDALMRRDPSLEQVLDSIGGECFADHASELGGLAVEDCE